MAENRPIEQIVVADNRIYPEGFNPTPVRDTRSRVRKGLSIPAYINTKLAIAPMDYIQPTLSPENAKHLGMLKRIVSGDGFGTLLRKLTSSKVPCKLPIHWDLPTKRGITGIPEYYRMLPPFGYE